MGQKKFAHNITLDFRNHDLLIDGVPFPFWIEPSPQVDLPHADATKLTTLRIGVFTESLTVIDEHGLTKTVVESSRDDDLRWAEARAKEIVYHGLADIIEQLPR
jgi:hypothetical protein